jgi:nitrite reductase/ring-hydroxylating ferredoxin subunit
LSQVTLKARPAPGQAICRLDQLDPDLGTWRLIWHEWDQPFRVFLVRQGDNVFAYRNQCPHALAYLDHPPGAFFSHDRQYLQCSFHGALFRIEDGHCVAGPCRERRLTPFPIRIANGVVYVAEPEKPAYERTRARVRLARGHRG